jgi:hypothetical protein
MRVNIGYGCDLEDVEEELANFLERVGLKLNEAAAKSNKLAELVAGKEYNPQEVLSHVHGIRVSLSKLDLRLEDVTTIVAGLDNAKKAAEEEVLNPSPKEPAEEEAAPAVSVVETVPAEDKGSRVKSPATGSKNARARKKKRGH